MIERPNREPDIVLPANNKYYAGEYWLTEGIYAIHCNDAVRISKQSEDPIRHRHPDETIIEYLTTFHQEEGYNEYDQEYIEIINSYLKKVSEELEEVFLGDEDE